MGEEKNEQEMLNLVKLTMNAIDSEMRDKDSYMSHEETIKMNLRLIVAKEFQEEKIEAMIKQLIEKAKEEFKQLLIDEENFDSNTKEALKLIGYLRDQLKYLEEGKAKYDKRIFYEIEANLGKLKRLIERKINLTGAMRKLTAKLEQILDIIRKQE